MPATTLKNPNRSVVFLTYCADETDSQSLVVCQQIVEGLYTYGTAGAVEPALAEACVASEEGTVWTCTLREGVKFHDGSELDAVDVITSWGAAIDFASPYHGGNKGSFDYYAYFWNGLVNQPE